jgi:DeoR family transcriptional regulator of aga operon
LALCRADWVFLGVSAVHPRAGLTSVYAENAAVRRAMVAVSERAVVLADGSKIGQVAPHLIARLDSIHASVTDAGSAVAELEAVGLKPIVADP